MLKLTEAELMLNYTENLKRRKIMEKIKDIWCGLNKKGKIATVAIAAIVVLIIWGQIF